MDRTKKIREFWDRSGKLSLQNEEYKQYFLDFIYRKLEEDKFGNDITTNSLIEPDRKIKAQIVARAAGIVSGVGEISYFFEKENIAFDKKINDGDAAGRDEVIFYIEGDARKILSFERAVLNILQRMGGIATMTYNLQQKIKTKNCFVAGTRKTLSLLDKKAISVGGGLTHRLNLEDAVLIKDNHLRAISFDNKKAIETSLKQISEKLKNQKIEIEVNNEEEVLAAAETISNLNVNNNEFAIMFDNMRPSEIKNAIIKIKKLGSYDDILFEASGNINEKNIAQYSESGADVVSIGALTHSVKAFNISLRIV